jgi:hypothetical protein
MHTTALTHMPPHITHRTGEKTTKAKENKKKKAKQKEKAR